jgi:hypothetical protein
LAKSTKAAVPGTAFVNPKVPWREVAICLSPLVPAFAPFILLFAWALVSHLASRACGFANHAANRAPEVGLFCLEFFLNRYQSLLGVFVAFVAAIIAVRPVWRQVRLMNQQAAAQLAPLLKIDIANVDRDRSIIDKMLQVENEYYLLNIIFETGSLSAQSILDGLRNVERHCAEISDSDWLFFCERPDVSRDERLLRRGIKEDFNKVREESRALSRFSVLGQERFIDRAREHARKMEAELEVAVMVLQLELTERREALLHRYDGIAVTLSAM